MLEGVLKARGVGVGGTGVRWLGEWGGLGVGAVGCGGRAAQQIGRAAQAYTKRIEQRMGSAPCSVWR